MGCLRFKSIEARLTKKENEGLTQKNIKTFNLFILCDSDGCVIINRSYPPSINTCTGGTELSLFSDTVGIVSPSCALSYPTPVNVMSAGSPPLICIGTSTYTI